MDRSEAICSTIRNHPERHEPATFDLSSFVRPGKEDEPLIRYADAARKGKLGEFTILHCFHGVYSLTSS
jgi:hypothetical protein